MQEPTESRAHAHDHGKAVNGSPFTRQRWHAYRPEQHAAWAALYARRMPALQETASRVYLDGAAAIGLEERRIPDLALLNRRLIARTGWSAVAVTGFLPAGHFFRCLARRRFPTTVSIRPMERLDYTPEPDIFHDVFGHVPLHADPVFAAFLQRVGALGAAARTPEATEQVARFFWFTVEFGLVLERGRPRLFGSGLISSSAEGVHALGPSCDRRPFDLEEVIATPFEIDKLQPVLFMVESFEELFGGAEKLGRMLV
ncbi:MAG: phenylalanine 4-monooxygenase [Gemmatimonadales bacterium]